MSADASVIVVGAGPVGLACAIEARINGLPVIVVEPRLGEIDKACGEGLMPGAVLALARLGVDPAGWDLRGIAYLSGDRRVEHRFDATTGIGRGVRRTVLQRALADRATELGVEFVTGKVSALGQDSDGVRVALGEGEGGGAGAGHAPSRSTELRADWLIGCDGLHSTVRRLAHLEGRPQASRRRRYGLRRHYHVPPWTDLVEVHWTPNAEAYVTPVAADIVGVALLGPTHTDFETTLAGIPGLAERLRRADPAGSIRGAGPLLQRSRHRSSGRILLAGDASGYVDALTGEGLRVGFAQAHAALDAIVHGDAAAYEREWIRGTRDFRILTTGLVAAARSPFRGRIVPTAIRNPAVFGRVVERLAR